MPKKSGNTNSTNAGGAYEKFGEFDSWEEINRAAAAQKAEGDFEAVKAIADENGIDEMDAQDYLDGMMPELCTPLTAANGKLDVEAAGLHLLMMMQMWVDHIRGMFASDSGELVLGIRRKGKNIVDLLAQLIVECSHTRKDTPAKIVNAARKLDSSIPATLPTADISKKRFEEIVRNYYIAPMPAKKEKEPEVAPVQQEEAPEETEGGDDE